MKKIFALMIALLALLTVAATAEGELPAVSSEEHFQVEWNDNATCLITWYEGPGGNVVIPEKINGGEVVAICGFSFMENESITGVIIPEGVEWIGSEAFAGCKNLESVMLPSTLWTISDRAFADCIALTEINLPEGVDYIDPTAFEGCDQLNLEAVMNPEPLSAEN